MNAKRPFIVEAFTALALIVGALCPAPSWLRADDYQPHPYLGLVRARLRLAVRLRRPPVVRSVRILRHGRYVRRLPADRSQLSLRAGVDRDRRAGRGSRRLSRRPGRAQAHGHLFRDDHGCDRGSVFLHRVQSAVGLHGRREWPARRANAELQLRFCHTSLRHRLVDVRLSGVLVLRRPRDRAAHRALAGGRDLERAARQPAASRGARPQHTRIQAHRLRDRCGLCRVRRGPPRNHARLYAAGRLHVRHIRPARYADGDRGRRHAVWTAGRRSRLALPQRFLSEYAASRSDLEARARRRVRTAGLLPEAGHRRGDHRRRRAGRGSYEGPQSLP